MSGCSGPLVDVVDAIPLPPPPEPVERQILSPAGLELVVHFEIVSPGYYSRHLVHPIWPGGASGVTIGIGYDLGHQLASTIRLDWDDHPQAGLLPPAAGVTRDPAKRLAAEMATITTPFPLAKQVFSEATVSRYWQSTARAYPGVEELTQGAKDALFSLTYNRGPSMAGHRAKEKRHIRDICIPRGDYQCIANQIREMVRLWKGTAIENGMTRRRNAEAMLVLG